ncbi:unnamed protein product [Adineta ricciae]|uniref:Uncharacterized protein n=1 Tax=Adineta ricciae TaxID=249248 RepID=A0A813MXN8_ADIRI|nr:unnamed protein product [Adineta ricciae]
MARYYYDRNVHRFRHNRKRYPHDGNDDDNRLFLDTSTRRHFESTGMIVGIEERSFKLTDWFSIVFMLLAAVICLIASIVLCRQQIDHRYHAYSRTKRREITDQNRNNNQTSLNIVDVAECIDKDIDFVEGLQILLARGSLILNEIDAQLLNSMTTFDRLQYFQKLTNYVKS